MREDAGHAASFAGASAHDFNMCCRGIILNNEDLMTSHPVGDPSLYYNLSRSTNSFDPRKDLVRMLLA